jgi:tripartite-type tricarboxylate transporter receptor subunit TctC
MANIPTATEAGYDVPVQQSRAIVAPKGTPKEVIDRLRAAFLKSFEARRTRSSTRSGC